MQGQRPFYSKGKYEIQLIKLALAINLQVEGVALFRVREQIRKGLRELRRAGYLDRWKIRKDDLVLVWKKALPAIGC